MPRIVKRVIEWSVFPEGEEDTYRIPEGSAMALPATNEFQIMDIRIVKLDGGGYALAWREEHEAAEHGERYPTLAAAEEAAERFFGVGPGDWDAETPR